MILFENINLAREYMNILSDSIMKVSEYPELITHLNLIHNIAFNANQYKIMNSWNVKRELRSILPEISSSINKFYK